MPKKQPPKPQNGFWNKVIVRGDNDCWTWTGKTRRGYGRVYLPGGKYVPATKVAWEIMYRRPFPKGMIACHSCDNPICVNPRHIFAGTHLDNTRDCINKGRRAPQDGMHNGNSKLTADEVRKIRQLYASGKFPIKQIASFFCVGKSQVHNIVSGASWVNEF